MRSPRGKVADVTNTKAGSLRLLAVDTAQMHMVSHFFVRNYLRNILGDPTISPVFLALTAPRRIGPPKAMKPCTWDQNIQ